MVRRTLAGMVETGPNWLADTQSLGDIIAASQDRAVHILFVHGFRTGDRGSSAAFRASLRRYVKGLIPGREELGRTLDVGPRPRFTYMGWPVWRDDDLWKKGAPFVDRYRLERKGGSPPVVVDEVNWWPLAMPLRCLALLAPEAGLAGPDRKRLLLCAGLDADGRPLDDGVHPPWIDRERLEQLLRSRPPLGGAAKANGFVKQELVDWGFSDAVIALGPMKRLLHETIEKACGFAADFGAEQGAPSRYVVVAESLGSFIVFDAYAHAKRRVSAVLDETAYVYFFANQLALLELARLSEAAAPSTEGLSLHQSLTRWANARRELKQIIAFSDPSDALTFRVPAIPGALVVNVCDRVGEGLFRLIADPIAAHIGHSRSKAVLRLMLKRR